MIIKLKEVIAIIQCENGKLLHELQYIKQTLKMDKTSWAKHEEGDRHNRENPPAKPYYT